MNYLEAYKIFTGGNKSPEIYHEWAALSTLSSFASRRFWLDQGIDRSYLNLYVLFVGPAGNGKSTSMGAAEKLVKNFPKPCPITPNSQTWQSCVKDLGDPKMHRREFAYQNTKTTYTHCSLFCDELASLLQNDPKGWITFMTQLYHGSDFQHKVKVADESGHRHDAIKNPNLVFLGCMTPDLTQDLVKDGIVSTGFNRRCIFVYANRSGKRIAIRPPVTQEQLNAREVCIQWATQLIESNGPFSFTDEARDFFTAWYNTNQDLVESETVTFMQSWLDCKDQIILKVAMLLELGDNLERKINLESLKKAIKLVSETEINFHKIFNVGGRNPIATLQHKIYAAISSVRTPTPLKKITSQFTSDGTVTEIQNAISNLIESGRIIQKSPTINGAIVSTVGTPEQFQADSDPAPRIERPKTDSSSHSNQFGFEDGPPD